MAGGEGNGGSGRPDRWLAVAVALAAGVILAPEESGIAAEQRSNGKYRISMVSPDGVMVCEGGVLCRSA